MQKLTWLEPVPHQVPAGNEILFFFFFPIHLFNSYLILHRLWKPLSLRNLRTGQAQLMPFSTQYVSTMVATVMLKSLRIPIARANECISKYKNSSCMMLNGSKLHER